MLKCAWMTAILMLSVGPAAMAEDLTFKAPLVTVLMRRIPEILDAYDPETGHFGSGIWICNDQNNIYPLAVAYAYESPGSRYYKDPKLLGVIMKAGDALIEDADEEGRWEFRKKDGSTWGMIHMPWVYSRWARSFGLIRDDMPPERREKWEAALMLGYSRIAERALGRVHNIPAHHAMGLYAAGLALEREEWRRQAADFLLKVCKEQAEGGYWSEGSGPVVSYNFVYTDALGTYYAMSKDERVLGHIDKAAVFHRRFTYPDGARVETVDERNPYHPGVTPGNVGFTFTPVGRAYLRNQWANHPWDRFSADYIASLLLYGEEGPVAEEPPGASGALFVLREGGEGRAATLRHGPWFVCVSAYHAPIPRSRWIQDRQNLVSIYHDEVGLILGGGNTKLQPAWSNFTVGEMALLRHEAGDENPDFLPKGELYHVPSRAVLVEKPELGLDLAYGAETCRVRVQPKDARSIEYRIAATSQSGLPVAAHLTLLPHLQQPLETGGGQTTTIGDEPVTLSADEVGGSVTYGGYRVVVPETASLHWPALPHNPYRKDGRGDLTGARIEVRIPFDAAHAEHTVLIHILERRRSAD